VDGTDSHPKIKEDLMGLIVSRKLNESIIIKTELGQIEIIVTNIHASRVSVKVECPREFLILRKELDKTPVPKIQEQKVL
jgi:carbon storage regulator CsrA